MNNKNYLENISAKIGFFAKYFRFFRFLLIVAYLFYLETMVVNVFSAVEYVPSIDEVKGRFTLLTAKNDIINSIEKYFSDKESKLTINLQKGTGSNPFAPHKIEDLNSSIDNSSAPDNAIIPENTVIN